MFSKNIHSGIGHCGNSCLSRINSLHTVPSRYLYSIQYATVLYFSGWPPLQGHDTSSYAPRSSPEVISVLPYKLSVIEQQNAQLVSQSGHKVTEIRDRHLSSFGGPRANSAPMTRATTSIAVIKDEARKHWYTQIMRRYFSKVLLKSPSFSAGRMMARTGPSRYIARTAYLLLFGRSAPAAGNYLGAAFGPRPPLPEILAFIHALYCHYEHKQYGFFRILLK